MGTQGGRHTASRPALATTVIIAYSFVLNLVFAGNIDPAGHAQGSLVVIRGTGGLADLHGLLRLEGQSGVGGTYTGTVTFAS